MHFTITSLNTCGYHTHLSNLLNDFDIMSSNILCLQEVNVKVKDSDPFTEKYNYFYIHGIHGLLNLTRKELKTTKIHEYITQNVEVMTMIVTYLNNAINITNIYVRPKCDINDIKSALNYILNNIDPNNTLYIVGDFNTNMQTMRK